MRELLGQAISGPPTLTLTRRHSFAGGAAEAEVRLENSVDSILKLLIFARNVAVSRGCCVSHGVYRRCLTLVMFTDQGYNLNSYSLGHKKWYSMASLFARVPLEMLGSAKLARPVQNPFRAGVPCARTPSPLFREKFRCPERLACSYYLSCRHRKSQKKHLRSCGDDLSLHRRRVCHHAVTFAAASTNCQSGQTNTGPCSEWKWALGATGPWVVVSDPSAAARCHITWSD